MEAMLVTMLVVLLSSASAQTDEECLELQGGLTDCLDFQSPGFCDGDCPQRIRNVFENCTDGGGLVNTTNLVCSDEGQCTIQLGSLIDCFEANITSNLSAAVEFCNGSCLQRIINHFDTCPDEQGLRDVFVTECACISEQNQVFDCFQVIDAAEGNFTEEFCLSDCPQRMRTVFSTCERGSRFIEPVNEGCQGREATAATTVGDSVTTSSATLPATMTAGVVSLLAVTAAMI